MTTPLVLVGLELAPADSHVLDTALLFAKELGGSVHAIHALDLGEHPSEQELAKNPAARAMVEQVRERVGHAERELGAISARYATFGVPLEASAQRGRPYEALQRLAVASKSAGREVMIVVGSGRMQGTLAERLLGSTTDQLLRHIECPVVVVPHGDRSRAHAGGITHSPHGGTWLVAIDGSEPCARALDLAAAWSARMGAELSLVHASSDRQAHREMHRFVASSTNPQLAALADGIAVLEDAPHAAITGQASAVGASLIVIGTHARTGVARAFLGSVAASVIRNANVPVLCVR
jgi:nucleotide-binding universal stress UspA family protein